MGDYISSIREILISTFPNSDVPNNCSDLKIGDLDEWDSLGNFNLLLAIESEYGLRFSLEEMSGIKSVSSIVVALNEKM